jgi:hypothetical protein
MQFLTHSSPGARVKTIGFRVVVSLARLSLRVGPASNYFASGAFRPLIEQQLDKR